MNYSSEEKTARVKGFTLIELLVVISIIALLLSILAPSLSMVKLRAAAVVCGSHLHQMGVVFQTYAADYNDKYAPHDHLTVDVLYHAGGLDLRDSYGEYADNVAELFYCKLDDTGKRGPDWISETSSAWGGWNTNCPNIAASYSIFLNYTNGGVEPRYFRNNKRIKKIADSRHDTAMASDSCAVVFPSMASAYYPGLAAGLSLNPPEWDFSKSDCFVGESAGMYVNGLLYGHRKEAGGISVLWGDASVERRGWRDVESQQKHGMGSIDFY